MAPVPLARLVALQNHRAEEIRQIGDRMRDRGNDTLNRTIVQTRVEAVNEIWAEARKTHHDITLRADSDEHPYVQANLFQDMRRAYEETFDWLVTALVNFSSEGERNPRQRARNNDDEDDHPVKLPKLDLPTFSGNYEDWDSFADLFTTLVHDAPRIKDTTKLQYLKSCLKGTAAELIKDVAILGINYASTWKALQDRFHNPRLTINKLLDSLFALPHLKKESAVELRAFVDETQRIIRALTNLRAPVAQWDLLLVHLIEIRLDSESRKFWESELTVRDRQRAADRHDNEVDYIANLPKFVDLVAFLERRAQSLTAILADKDDKKTYHNSNSNSSKKVHHMQAGAPARAAKCALCSGDHFISRCSTFIAKNVDQKQNDVRHLRLCFNCLGNHKYKNCKSTFSCKHCREKHHSLLHIFGKGSNKQPNSSSNANPQGNSKAAPASQVRSNVAQLSTNPSVSVNACKRAAPKECTILLATAQVTVIGPNGRQTRARVLLDQGSEATFISDSLVQLLRLPKDRVDTSLTGVGGCEAGVAKFATSFVIQSAVESGFELNVNAYVLCQLTSELPSRTPIDLDLEAFKCVTLADPEFYLSDRVDILIGADLYGHLIREGLKRFPDTLLIGQNTALGWVISGPTNQNPSGRAATAQRGSVKALRCAVSDDLTEALQRFWTLEEVPSADKKLKPMDEACEKLFVETHTRDADGRFRVRLPLTTKPPRVAAETRRMALGSLKHQHQRFERDPKLASAYRDFMNTYLELGHMERVPNNEINNPCAWYLPHHAVITGVGEKLKYRVVFDASRQTREKRCLNDFLMTGQPLQSDLMLILLNWRRYRYAFTADIVKMFRQIRLSREDQDLHRIMWSPSSAIPPADHRLTTVTYGTASAPFLAIRTLLQLARDERQRFPLGAACLESNTYVDDMFAGADELATALRIRDELIGILHTAGIELDKWAANKSELLPMSKNENDKGEVKEIESDSSVKTLGVNWNPSNDKFSFSASNIKRKTEKLTKRTTYSELAQLYDPLGWLAPVTVVAKIIMQDIWLKKCDWDEPLPADISQRWEDYCYSLSDLPSLSIDRWLGLTEGKQCEIIGFSDASKRAYAAAVYLRIHLGNGKYRVMLLAAKTKVSPVKTVSIPKLELLGATVLVKLVCHLQKIDFLKNLSVRLFTDSKIVLDWLEKHPCHWETFVANRVSLIQTELADALWGHVVSAENPADIATKGATPKQLKSLPLWWFGPDWLKSPSQDWPRPPQAVQALHVRPRVVEPWIFTRYSSLTQLIRITAWSLRPFLQRVRSKAAQGSYPRTWLTVAELDNARDTLIKLAQAHAYSAELDLMRNRRALPKQHPLRKLKPFLDYDGILRVGGRLSNANLPFHVRFPPILPKDSVLSKLFVRYAHAQALHGGPTLTISYLLRHAWIVGMRILVKHAIHHCVKCQRHTPRLAHQLMGDLPATRLTSEGAFATAGLDYAGPFQLRASSGRGQKSYKGYIALFVCFASKAIHLEPVSDLTSAKFILALRRFMNARGECTRLYSDNSTTFRGADAELRAMFRKASAFYDEVAPQMAERGITWTFIPPTTPHYGGLWEAGVKSVKNLLKKTIGETKLTFEEFATVLSDIATCLNSRPLNAYTSDPEDLRVLTPAHFLTERPSVIIPDEDTTDIPLNRLDRYQLLQRLRDQFWKRWQNEYVVQLQERKRWRNDTDNFTVGQLVVIKDDRYPASKWPLGRVIETHPGKDGLVRVVTVKTATNTLRRHIACLAPIHTEDKEDEPKRG